MRKEKSKHRCLHGANRKRPFYTRCRRIATTLWLQTHTWWPAFLLGLQWHRSWHIPDGHKHRGNFVTLRDHGTDANWMDHVTVSSVRTHESPVEFFPRANRTLALILSVGRSNISEDIKDDLCFFSNFGPDWNMSTGHGWISRSSWCSEDEYNRLIILIFPLKLPWG